MSKDIERLEDDLGHLERRVRKTEINIAQLTTSQKITLTFVCLVSPMATGFIFWILDNLKN